MSIAAQSLGGGSAKKSHTCPNPVLLSDPGNIFGRLDPQYRNPDLDEIPQQISVVAGDFDHLAIAPDAEAFDHCPAIVMRVPQPAFGVRREIRVLAEDVLR